MDRFDRERASEMVLHILNVTGGADIYHIVKILYFAEMKHLAKHGIGFVPGGFSAWKYGPVPTEVYEMLSARHQGSPFVMLPDDASGIFVAGRDADMDYLSKSEAEAIGQSIEENAGLSFNELVGKSHDEAWRAAGSNGRLSPKLIAKAGGASEGMLEYVGEQMEVDLALS